MIQGCAHQPRLGLPFRPALIPTIYDLQARGALAFCEVNLEQLVKPTAAFLDCLDTLVNCGVDIRLHSVGILPETDFALQLQALDEARRWCSPSVLSVHAATCCGAGHYGESFQRPQYASELLDKLAAHLVRLSELAKIPIAVENIAVYDNLFDDSVSELHFLAQLANAASVTVVFDVSNHLTTYGLAVDNHECTNLVTRLPLTHLHVSGGRWLDGRYYDTHLDPIPNAHIELCRSIVSMMECDVLYERDGRYEREAEVANEILSLLQLCTTESGELE